MGEGGFVTGLAPQIEFRVSPIFGVDFGVFSLPLPFISLACSTLRLRDKSWVASVGNGDGVANPLDVEGACSRTTSGTSVGLGSITDDR